MISIRILGVVALLILAACGAPECEPSAAASCSSPDASTVIFEDAATTPDATVPCGTMCATEFRGNQAAIDQCIATRCGGG